MANTIDLSLPSDEDDDGKVVRVDGTVAWARVFVMPQLSTVTPDRYLAAPVSKAPRYE